MLARKYILNKPFDGEATLENFKLIEETLPELEDGEILCKAEWHTVDPYMKLFGASWKVGEVLPGQQAAKIIKSKNAEYPVGTGVLLGDIYGWRDLTVVKPRPISESSIRSPDMVRPLDFLGGLPGSYALGPVGMPGNTAYFGLTRVCNAKPGETLVVSAAAGAVGSIVGQIGKILGCKVIGFAGSDEKVKWVKDTLGFDLAFNYKKCDVYKTLQKYAPQGVDCYFDNVGGEFLFNVLRNMNTFGRIAICGAISTYNNEPNKPALVPMDFERIIYNGIKLDGFRVSHFTKDWNEGLHLLRDWILAGKIKVEETIVEGFENMPNALMDLIQGKNTGKMIIKS